jgi:hypothetical protein
MHSVYQKYKYMTREKIQLATNYDRPPRMLKGHKKVVNITVMKTLSYACYLHYPLQLGVYICHVCMCMLDLPGSDKISIQQTPVSRHDINACTPQFHYRTLYTCSLRLQPDQYWSPGGGEPEVDGSVILTILCKHSSIMLDIG